MFQFVNFTGGPMPNFQRPIVAGALLKKKRKRLPSAPPPEGVLFLEMGLEFLKK